MTMKERDRERERERARERERERGRERENKEPKMDAAGSHGLVCHPGVKAMRATVLEKALDKCFRQAGGNPMKQPSTYSGYFSKEDLSGVFPGKLNQATLTLKLAMKFLDIVPKSLAVMCVLQSLVSFANPFPILLSVVMKITLGLFALI